MGYNPQTLNRCPIRCGLGAAAAALLCLLMFSRPGLGQPESPPPDIRVGGIKPAVPLTTAEVLKPGLSVFYISGFFRHIDDMLSREGGRKQGKPGPPILQLNHQFDKGPVFDSGKTRGVGVYLFGLIRLSQPGRYIFTAQSNDGIRVFINDRMVINDPEVHGARFSNRGIVEIEDAGWYDIAVQYFQRKGTAMLEFYWQMPGADDRVIVPAEVLAHR